MAEITLIGLRVVRAVAAGGSFTAAAEALGYTQSAVSRQIAATEAAAGSVLFTRQARGVTPTPAGEVLVERAANVLAEIEMAEQTLAGLRDRLAGRLSLGVFPTAAAVLAPRAIAALAADHPGLAVTLDEASTPVLLRRLHAGRIEVAVIGVGTGLADYDLAGLRSTVLVVGDLRVAVPAAHRLAGRRRVSVDDLRPEPWIVAVGSPGDPQFGAWPTLDAPRIAYTVRSLPARLGLVAAGLGISVLPAIAAASVPSGVRVVEVDDVTWRGRSAIAVTGLSPSPAADSMVRALQRAASRLEEPRSGGVDADPGESGTQDRPPE